MAQSSIHEDIPTEQAWKEGRRIYVRCSRESRLNAQIRNLEAKWDPAKACWWVGSGKLESVVPLVLAHMATVAETQATLAEGVEVSIPFEAVGIRDAAKAAGARWNAQRKVWAVPAAAAPAIEDMIRARRAAAVEAREAQAARSAADVLAASGRVAVAGADPVRTGNWLETSGPVRKAEALRLAPQVGQVRLMSDGRRYLVTSAKVEFVGADGLLDFQGPRRDRPGWWWSTEGIEVESTDAEIAATEEAQRVEAAATARADGIAAILTATLTTTTEVPAETPGWAWELGTGGVRVIRGWEDGTVRTVVPPSYDDARCAEGPVTGQLAEQARKLAEEQA